MIQTAINVAGPQVQQFIDQYRPNFPTGWSDRVASQVWLHMSLMEIPYVPHMVFIDRQGVLRADYPGQNPFWTNQDGSIRAELDKMLKASPPARPAAKKARRSGGK